MVLEGTSALWCPSAAKISVQSPQPSDGRPALSLPNHLEVASDCSAPNSGLSFQGPCSGRQEVERVQRLGAQW